MAESGSESRSRRQKHRRSCCHRLQWAYLRHPCRNKSARQNHVRPADSVGAKRYLSKWAKYDRESLFLFLLFPQTNWLDWRSWKQTANSQTAKTGIVSPVKENVAESVFLSCAFSLSDLSIFDGVKGGQVRDSRRCRGRRGGG